MKVVVWWGSSLDDVRTFPDLARQHLGFQLSNVQDGRMPDDFKSFSAVGPGVCEIRVQADGQWRVMYVAKFAVAIYVLHAFQKKSQQTSAADIAIARQRYRELIQERKHGRKAEDDPK